MVNGQAYHSNCRGRLASNSASGFLHVAIPHAYTRFSRFLCASEFSIEDLWAKKCWELVLWGADSSRVFTFSRSWRCVTPRSVAYGVPTANAPATPRRSHG